MAPRRISYKDRRATFWERLHHAWREFKNFKEVSYLVYINEGEPGYTGAVWEEYVVEGSADWSCKIKR